MNETVAAPVAAVAAVGAPVLRNEVLITIGGNDEHIPLEALGLTMDSTEREIIAAVRPLMRERHGIDIADQEDVRGEGAYADVTYVTRKALNENVIHVYPKPTAGYTIWFF